MALLRFGTTIFGHGTGDFYSVNGADFLEFQTWASIMSHGHKLTAYLGYHASPLFERILRTPMPTSLLLVDLSLPEFQPRGCENRKVFSDILLLVND